ncbi:MULTISPECIES: TonB-dependent receptor plug domain-containing protein [Eikenella]|uniref:TonB-dependent receptor plug domain-containing protein n=1 Tax=Eikenella TaxID=538 RepID=UPI0015CF8EBE|nr:MULTISPECIES: TonB-dependent receptor plug domain-containing protein [Eikenella]
MTALPARAAEEAVDSAVLPVIEIKGQRALSTLAGQSRLSRENIDQQQADNVAALLDLLPGTSSSGSPRPGGQTLNIWGFGDNEDIKISIDGAAKNFERYRQGSVFIEPELLRQVTVDKGSFDVSRGNGGFGGAVKLESRDAQEFCAKGRMWADC